MNLINCLNVFEGKIPSDSNADHYIITKLVDNIFSTGKGKAIPVTGYDSPWSCEMSRLPHFLDNRLTDGGEVVSPMHRPPFTPRKIPVRG
jgi:hypothetical protein